MSSPRALRTLFRCSAAPADAASGATACSRTSPPGEAPTLKLWTLKKPSHTSSLHYSTTGGLPAGAEPCQRVEARMHAAAVAARLQEEARRALQALCSRIRRPLLAAQRRSRSPLGSPRRILRTWSRRCRCPGSVSCTAGQAVQRCQAPRAARAARDGELASVHGALSASVTRRNRSES